MATATKQMRTKPEERRAQILEESIRLFGEDGYHGFRVQELAKRCGLTNGGVLYHFKTKDELFAAVLNELLRREVAEVVASVDGLGETGQVTLTTVHKALRAVMEQTVAQPEAARLFAMLQAEALNPSHPAHRHFAAQQDYWLSQLANLVSPFCEDAESMAWRISALVGGLQILWLQSNKGFDILVEWDVAIAAILPSNNSEEA